MFFFGNHAGKTIN